ncbi:nucleolar pre-ribosomal-associated protein 1-like [Physella acuta]|uniref:nucleolar pre-ribosomal-associated protein 1-like n=1 Tax=Physella acuta TaxID=109671 RepID=UPI0027DE92B2|nr:nucleolar pre-ribosomal-associated protein 1-like [Physella acuta]
MAPQKLAKKRPHSDDSENDSDIDLDAKKVKDDDKPKATITEVEFKFLLRDPSTVNEALEKFIHSAEAFDDGVPCHDIVLGYCRSSPSCAEIWTLIDPTSTSLKTNDISLVLQCLEKILTRIRTDLSKLSSTGEAIVQKILAAHMGQVYTCLRDQNKSKIIKSALQLLIAMIMLSEKSKKAVLARLNFGHVNFPSLFRRRNRKDTQDVRSCIVLLTLAFLLDSDHSVVNTIVQQKTFLQMTIAGLKYDSREMVVDTLATLMDKVVRCPGVTKTDKIKLFSEVCLKHLCELFHWVGPTGWLATGKKKKDKDDGQPEVSDESVAQDREMVASVAQDFLNDLCCSYKHGINFNDKLLGTGTRNQNQLLCHLLEWLVKRTDDPHSFQLAKKILCACPDQIKSVLTTLGPSLTPRWSDKWRTLMEWVTSLYSSLPELPVYLSSREKEPRNVKINITLATVFCLPPPKIALLLTQGLKHDDLRVRHQVLELLKVLAKKAVLVQKEFMKADLTRESTVDEFTATVLKTLPPISLVFTSLDKFMLLLSKGDKAINLNVSKHVVALLQVLILYQTLSPSLISERPKDLAKLIEMVGNLNKKNDSLKTKDKDADEESDEDDEENEEVKNMQLPQLYLIKLLSETDTRKIALGREGLLEKLLVSASQSGIYKDLNIGLICKMLKNIEVFTGHSKELEIWLKEALRDQGSSAETFHHSRIVFLARCLASLINNPTPYVDRMMEIVADSGGSDLQDDVDMETISVGTSESAIDAILLMDDAEIDQMLENYKPSESQQQSLSLPLTPLSLVALDSLQHSKTDDAVVTKYASKVLVCLVHSLHSTNYLASCVTKSPAKLFKGVREYLEFWSSKMPQMKDLPVLPPKLFGPLSSQLTEDWSPEASAENVVKRLKPKVSAMTLDDKIMSLGQLTLYIGFTAVSNDKETKLKRLQVYTDLAEVLLEAVSAEEKWNSDSVVTMETDQQTSQGDDLASSATEGKDTLRTSEVFSEMFSCMSSLENNAINAVVSLLKNPVLKSQMFVVSVKKKTLKKRNSVGLEDFNTCSILSFFCNVLKMCSNWAWFRNRKDIIDDFVFQVLDQFSNTASPLSNEQRKLCLDVIKTLYPLLDIVSLSSCLAKLSNLPLSAFVKSESSDPEQHKETPVCKLLFRLLEHWTLLVKDSPAFSQTSFFHQLKQKPEPTSEKAGNDPQFGLEKKHIKIKTKFCFEDTTQQKISILAPFFELLPYCKHPKLLQFVIFWFEHIPQAVSVFNPTVFAEMFKTPLKIEKGSLEEQVVTTLVQHMKESYLLCDQWLMKRADKAVKTTRWEIIISYLEASNTFQCGSPQTVEALKASLAVVLKSNIENFDDKLLKVLKLFSLNLGDSDQDFQKLLTNTLTTVIKKHVISDLRPHFDVIRASARLSTWPLGKGKQNVYDSPACLILDLCLTHLKYLTSSKLTRHTETEEYLLDLSLSLIPELKKSTLTFLIPYWGQLVMNTLKQKYKDKKLLELLSCLTPQVYALESPHKSATAPPTADKPYVSVRTMFQMIISHTGFVSVMLSDDTARDGLVKLLHCLFCLDPSCVESSLSKALVGAYGGMLSQTDQRLLIMIKKCQTSDKEFECPTLWGKAAVDNHTVAQVLGPSLDKQASVKSVLDQLDPAKIQDSILNFPVRRVQSGTEILDADEYKSKPECYDPNFLLKLFCQILTPDKIVPLRIFVEKGCLSYLLIALSSHDLQTRLLAYHALNDFYLHAEGSRWQERQEVTFLLDLLNASRSKDGQKLTYILALFFSRVVKLMLYPADPLYMPIFRFLVAKPEMDLTNVPEFYQLFFSGTVQYKQERNWLLVLLRDGMRENSDYWLYQKKLIFKILMCYHDSMLSDRHSQELILGVIRNACREKSVAVDLIKKHGLLSWLTAAVTDLKSRPHNTDHLCDIVHTLWFSLSTVKYLKDPATPSQTGVASSKLEGALGHQTGDTVNEGDEESDMETEETGKDNSKEEGKSTKTSSRVTVPRVPKSTMIQMGLIVKNLIWHLSNASVESVSQVVTVLHSMVCPDPCPLSSPPHLVNDTEPPTGQSSNRLSPMMSTGLLVLHPVESCLLLHHSAKLLNLAAVLKTVDLVLKFRGINTDELVISSTKKLSSPRKSSHKGDNSKEQNLNETAELEEEEDVGKVVDVDLARQEDLSGNKMSTVEKQKLLGMVHCVVTNTGTLCFV